MTRLRLNDFLRPADHFHFAVSEVHADAAPTHTHDFLEIFWIVEGSGVHWINGQERIVRPGVLIYIRSHDAHTFYTSSKSPMKLANAAFRPTTWKYLRKRYFAAEPDLFERRARLPCEQNLSPPEWNRLIDTAYRLSDPIRSRLAIETFLLEMARPRPESQLPPEWLQTALARLAEPGGYQEGTKGLVSMARRSPEHVAREVRRHMRCTLTDLVNQARLRHAAQLLTSSSRPILDVCFDCGFQNLSHFYKLFRASYGFSPRVYRQQSLQIAGQAPRHRAKPHS